jgi:hypothetical protein
VNAPVTVPNNLVLAIIASAVSLIFCCLPHGLVSLIFALQVDKKAQAGDIQGATNAARQAKMWAWISIIVTAVWFLVSLIFGVLGGILSAIQNH